MSIWPVFMPDNKPKRAEATRLKTEVFTLLEINCKYINDLVACMNKVEGFDKFDTITTDHEEDWAEYKYILTDLIGSIHAYLVESHPSLAGLLEPGDLYDFPQEEVPNDEVLIIWMFILFGPFGFITAERERHRLDEIIATYSKTLQKIQPGFEKFNKDILTITIILGMKS